VTSGARRPVDSQSVSVGGLTFQIMVGLNNCGFLGGSDRGRPRVDWSDLERYSDGVIALTGVRQRFLHFGAILSLSRGAAVAWTPPPQS
jgi:hypothetical protein